jgi:hypothetical protein
VNPSKLLSPSQNQSFPGAKKTIAGDHGLKNFIRPSTSIEPSLAPSFCLAHPLVSLFILSKTLSIPARKKRYR